uniref:Uncharacterized protein n=1 Tax=Fundulus heteroclitus TaxID=8078 RepID=A0A3Q2R264_FUNHE
MCVFRQWLWVKALSQSEHWKGLSPVWVLMWTLRYSRLRHAFPQMLQIKSLMPEWISMCSLVLYLKALLQTVQTNGLSVHNTVCLSGSTCARSKIGERSQTYCRFCIYKLLFSHAASGEL